MSSPAVNGNGNGFGNGFGNRNDLRTSAAGRLSPRRLGKVSPRALALVGLLLALAFAARACQQAQVRIPESYAIGKARARVSFSPSRTQIRLVRQGLNAHPFWAVSLSRVPSTGPQQIAVVRVDANTGEVLAVQGR